MHTRKQRFIEIEAQHFCDEFHAWVIESNFLTKLAAKPLGLNTHPELNRIPVLGVHLEDFRIFVIVFERFQVISICTPFERILIQLFLDLLLNATAVIEGDGVL